MFWTRIDSMAFSIFLRKRLVDVDLETKDLKDYDIIAFMNNFELIPYPAKDVGGLPINEFSDIADKREAYEEALRICKLIKDYEKDHMSNPSTIDGFPPEKKGKEDAKKG